MRGRTKTTPRTSETSTITTALPLQYHYTTTLLPAPHPPSPPHLHLHRHPHLILTHCIPPLLLLAPPVLLYLLAHVRYYYSLPPLTTLQPNQPFDPVPDVVDKHRPVLQSTILSTHPLLIPRPPRTKDEEEQADGRPDADSGQTKLWPSLTYTPSSPKILVSPKLSSVAVVSLISKLVQNILISRPLTGPRS
ncbi:hypothetical protein F5Y07DRAFT_109340 [Xylaria sp. FL0933]|nr:hypothetical protein F5Y07DRAFT_109340 [Xylaria sp. FL0933]